MIGYLLAVPQRRASFECAQHMFLWRSKKNIGNFWLKQKFLFWSYGLNVNCDRIVDLSSTGIICYVTVEDESEFLSFCATVPENFGMCLDSLGTLFIKLYNTC